jgi:hypothetical protein
MGDQERQRTAAGDGGKVEIGSRAAPGRRREQNTVWNQAAVIQVLNVSSGC